MRVPRLPDRGIALERRIGRAQQPDLLIGPVQAASTISSIEHLLKTGHSAPTAIFATLVGPVLLFIITFVWRFLTDPITHACWSGLTGYFIGLAATSRYRWYQVAWIGLAMAAILHGLNDRSQVNGRPVWILVVIISGILFLGYARVGARQDQQFTQVLPPAFWVRRAESGRPRRIDWSPR